MFSFFSKPFSVSGWGSCWTSPEEQKNISCWRSRCFREEFVKPWGGNEQVFSSLLHFCFYWHGGQVPIVLLLPWKRCPCFVNSVSRQAVITELLPHVIRGFLWAQDYHRSVSSSSLGVYLDMMSRFLGVAKIMFCFYANYEKVEVFWA